MAGGRTALQPWNDVVVGSRWSNDACSRRAAYRLVIGGWSSGPCLLSVGTFLVVVDRLKA